MSSITIGRATAPGLAFAGLVCAAVSAQDRVDASLAKGRSSATLEETRLIMDKWIETQQIISKERKEWSQTREILAGRVEVVKKELTTLDEKIKLAESSTAEASKKRGELARENEQVKATAAVLITAVTGMEVEVRRLFATVPEPVQAKLQPLFARIPEDAAKTRVSAAERFQNVLGILNELNKANNDLTISYEVRNLANGKPAEVKVIYVGLSQAYYVSAHGEAGIGRPSAEGWKWQPSNGIAANVVLALEIMQGKQSPAFVPLPVRLQ